MIYITSTIDQEYTMSGVELPKQSYNSDELSRGKRLVVAVSEGQYENMLCNKTFKSMVDNGSYIVSKEKPINKMNEMELEREAMKSSKEAQDLKEKLAKAETLIGKITAELAALKEERDSLLADLKKAVAEMKEKDDRIAELEAVKEKGKKK